MFLFFVYECRPCFVFLAAYFKSAQRCLRCKDTKMQSKTCYRFRLIHHIFMTKFNSSKLRALSRIYLRKLFLSNGKIADSQFISTIIRVLPAKHWKGCSPQSNTKRRTFQYHIRTCQPPFRHLIFYLDFPKDRLGIRPNV